MLKRSIVMFYRKRENALLKYGIGQEEDLLLQLCYFLGLTQYQLRSR
jgi:hypothetical protein